jgi:altronate dehydratase large subunit
VSDTFLGYPREDGQVGVRNFLLMLSGTLYANTLCERVADMLVNTIPIVHPLGRCQVKPDLALTYKTLVGHGCNPNAGGVVVVDHFKEEGCTADEIAHEIAKTGKPVEVINIRREGGLVSAIEKALRAGIEMQRAISSQPREPVPVSKLLFGVNCGTSDATSGLSSNPATGHCSDTIIGQGGRTLMAETMEMIGAEDVMLSRCRNEQVAAKLAAAIERMEQRALDAGADIRGSQPTGDNIVGGLSSIEEKSLGAVQKSGTAQVVDVIDYADRPGEEPGLYVMDTPGHGGESITGIAAGGCQVLVFSTGGGHTINHPLMITIRVTGNATSYEKMADTTEVSVADIFEGTSIAEAGERIYEEVLATASGKMTKAEICKEYNAFAIHRIGPSI